MTDRFYSENFDAYYDWFGNWLEPVCGDTSCCFCVDRPARAFETSSSGLVISRVVDHV